MVTEPLPKLRLENLSKTFSTDNGDFVALAPTKLDIPAGRFVSLIGPSGCGKTTIFNIVAGLLPPTTGRVLIDGEDATGFIGQVGYMLQKDLLLPWRTVLDNVALGMEIKGVPLKEARERALPLIQRYGLGGFEHQHPSALSGGMRQRAALLRTLLDRHGRHPARRAVRRARRADQIEDAGVAARPVRRFRPHRGVRHP